MTEYLVIYFQYFITLLNRFIHFRRFWPFNFSFPCVVRVSNFFRLSLLSDNARLPVLLVTSCLLTVCMFTDTTTWSLVNLLILWTLRCKEEKCKKQFQCCERFQWRVCGSESHLYNNTVTLDKEGDVSNTSEDSLHLGGQCTGKRTGKWWRTQH